MIQFTDVSLQLGTKILFDRLSFTLGAKDRIGLIGQNGTGKSTLFSLLKSERSPDKGEIRFPKNLRLSSVKQETPALDISALDYVLEGDEVYVSLQKSLSDAEASENIEAICQIHETMHQCGFYAKPAKAAELLHGLGFDSVAQQKSVSSFSGGWRMRLNLAQALISDSDILLLDEPTNHLDLEAVLWLEEWLNVYPGILVLISHDRDFLDAVVKGIFWLDQAQIKRFSGNYSSFESQKAMQLHQQNAALAKHQREKLHLESFINRFRAQATKAKQVQSRIKALERMGEMLPAYEASPFQFQFRENDQVVKDVLISLSKAQLGYEQNVILNEVTWQIPPQARIGLLGPNGAGKSTLIKTLAGELPLLAGERRKSPHLKLGYFSQHQLEMLSENRSPLWHLKELSPQISEQDARNFFGQFHFKGDVVFDSITHFSGGEKARLALALIVWQKPNLLLLDEPTNHLDIEMRQALIMALQSYENAVVVISHDRHLLRTITDDLFLVYGGKLSPFEGSIDDYPVWWRNEQKRLASAEKPPSALKEKSKSVRAPRALSTAEIQKNCDRLELEIAKVQQSLKDIDHALLDPLVYEGPVENLNAWKEKRDDSVKRLEALEAEWLEWLEKIS